MSALEANIELISTIPEELQGEIHRYLILNYCDSNPFKPLSRDDMMSELAESRDCYDRGEGEDFDAAVDAIGTKYGL